MGKQIGLVFGLLFLVSMFNQVGNGAVITSQLGDIDNFQSGDAADALFRSQTILDILVPRIEPSAYKESDFFLDNWDVPPRCSPTRSRRQTRSRRSATRRGCTRRRTRRCGDPPAGRGPAQERDTPPSR